MKNLAGLSSKRGPVRSYGLQSPFRNVAGRELKQALMRNSKFNQCRRFRFRYVAGEHNQYSSDQWSTRQSKACELKSNRGERTHVKAGLCENAFQLTETRLEACRRFAQFTKDRARFFPLQGIDLSWDALHENAVTKDNLIQGEQLCLREGYFASQATH